MMEIHLSAILLDDCLESGLVINLWKIFHWAVISKPNIFKAWNCLKHKSLEHVRLSMQLAIKKTEINLKTPEVAAFTAKSAHMHIMRIHKTLGALNGRF